MVFNEAGEGGCSQKGGGGEAEERGSVGMLVWWACLYGGQACMVGMLVWWACLYGHACMVGKLV